MIEQQQTAAPVTTLRRSEVYRLACLEVERAYAKHGQDQWGRHEFYAILREEVDEMWDVIKQDGPTDNLLSEMVQIVAMVIRYCETGNRYGGSL